VILRHAFIWRSGDLAQTVDACDAARPAADQTEH
jgi:hypothetical protein